MFYNCQVYDYEDFIQIRLYDKPIEYDKPDPLDRVTFDNAYLHEDVLPRFYETNFPNFHQMDFDEYIKEISYMINEEKILEKKRQRSLSNSVNRSKQSIYEYTYANRWEWFFTLTFSPNVVDRMDYDACISKVRKWLNNQRSRYATDLKYLFVPEEHKKGGWHIHGLLSGTGNMSFEDSGRVAVGKKTYKRTAANSGYKTVYNLSGWRFGFSTATQVEHNGKVCSYLAKYVTKDLAKSIRNRRRFYPSRNCDRCYVVRMNICLDDMEEYISAMSAEGRLDYVKNQEIAAAYQNIRYITIKK